jgi:hypothetical protein
MKKEIITLKKRFPKFRSEHLPTKIVSCQKIYNRSKFKKELIKEIFQGEQDE